MPKKNETTETKQMVNPPTNASSEASQKSSNAEAGQDSSGYHRYQYKEADKIWIEVESDERLSENVTNCANGIEENKRIGSTKNSKPTVITQQDLLDALAQTRSSVSESETKKYDMIYEKLRRKKTADHILSNQDDLFASGIRATLA